MKGAHADARKTRRHVALCCADDDAPPPRRRGPAIPSRGATHLVTSNSRRCKRRAQIANCVDDRRCAAVVLTAATRTIANTNRLRILAVGASVTAGCGSAEPPFDTRCAYSHNKSAIPMSRQCTLTGGWVRRLHDALPDALRQSGWHSPPRISTSVHAKNAVGAGFFARCTSHWMPHGVDIVLLDLAQVLAGLEADFSRLVDAIRRTAPRAAIVFIAWRQQGRRVRSPR